MPVFSLRLQSIGPFDDIEFEFDERINVFVGPNNSGKSTVLAAMGNLLVYPFGLPRQFLHGETSSFTISYSRPGSSSHTWQGKFPVNIRRTEEFLSNESVLSAIGYTYYVPALRMGTNFRSKGPGQPHAGDQPPDRSSRYKQLLMLEGEVGFEGRTQEFLKREHLFSNEPALLTDKQIVQAIIDLDYRAYREKKPGIRSIIGRIAEIASEITEGFHIEFHGIGEDSGGLFPQFKTPNGVMPLNALSQGTQSIIQWLSYFVIGYSQYYDFPESLEDKVGALLIDEVDAHLHPSWQRRILPTLTKHFPKLTIFCSTHSPLMLAGLSAGQVHLLKRDTRGKVTVSRNKTDIIGWSADEVLRTFLDVATPTDLRTESDLQKLQALRQKENLSTEDARQLDQLRYKVSQELLGSLADAEGGDHVSAWLETREKKPTAQQTTPNTKKRVGPGRVAPKRRASSAQRKPPVARKKVTKPRIKR